MNFREAVEALLDKWAATPRAERERLCWYIGGDERCDGCRPKGLPVEDVPAATKRAGLVLESRELEAALVEARDAAFDG